jgi:hypothetical protein
MGDKRMSEMAVCSAAAAAASAPSSTNGVEDASIAPVLRGEVLELGSHLSGTPRADEADDARRDRIGCGRRDGDHRTVEARRERLVRGHDNDRQRIGAEARIADPAAPGR